MSEEEVLLGKPLLIEPGCTYVVQVQRCLSFEMARAILERLQLAAPGSRFIILDDRMQIARESER
jgi:hypothetical protein